MLSNDVLSKIFIEKPLKILEKLIDYQCYFLLNYFNLRVVYICFNLIKFEHKRS
jgi:hypothetical protein